jgi:hypothetical protein
MNTWKLRSILRKKQKIIQTCLADKDGLLFRSEHDNINRGNRGPRFFFVILIVVIKYDLMIQFVRIQK